ncbi:MAG TPA: hypothetical protein ENG95_05545 [Nitrospirae bacterium]|nr:hypothetical protein [Nitrospirota bacterium]
MKKIKKVVQKEDNKDALMAAQKILQEEQMRNIKKFEAEYIALCKKFGLQIQAQTNLVVVPVRR